MMNNVSNHLSDPELHQVNVEPITPKLLNKRTTHSAYIKHSQEEAAVLRDLVNHIKANYPLDPLLESPLAVTPMNKVKRVRFTEPVTSSRNTKMTHTLNLASNKPMLSSTGVKQSTSGSGSQPSGKTKKYKIQQTPSSTLKNKVEAHPKKVKSSLKNKDCVVAPKGTAHVQHSKLNANYELKCVKCNVCMLFDNHNLCVLDFINNVNARAKSRSVKKNSKRKVWKLTGKAFTNIGYIWRPTGRTFTIVGNVCPLTRITTTTEVPLRKPITPDNDTPKPTATLVYSRKPRKSKTNVLVSNPKILQFVSTNKKEPNKSWGSIHSDVPSSSLDIGNVTISRVYYVEGLGHNLFFVGQFCDSNLEVAFCQHTCYIRNLEGVDLLTGSRGDNLYTLSLGDMIASSPICLLSKASKTKSWLWHRRLSHLNFGAINHLARHGLVRDLPKLKFEKDHLYSACALGKSTKKPHKPKSEDTNQGKLYLLHMDLCRLMRVMIQVQLKETVRRIRTNNGTEFINQTLREYYEKVGISHETSVARSPQQNGVVERRNRTLIEAARTMLIYAKAHLFLWAKAVATADNCLLLWYYKDLHSRAVEEENGKQRTVIYYNCKREGHMSKQCTKPKTKRDDSWFKDKVLLVQAQANGQILHEEELTFLADPGILEDGSDALAEVHNHDNVNNNMINQAVQAMQSSEQSNVVNHSETEITNFETRFVPQTDLSAKQAFWAQNSLNSPDLTLSSRPTKVEVPKELPKVNMVNTSLKKLKHHLDGFDVVVKERIKPSTSASGSQPSGNTKKDKIQQTPSSTQKNKVEAHPRKVKSSLKNKDCVVAPKGTAKRKVWKPTGKVFINIGYIWRPTGQTFTIVGNACPLTRINTTTEVLLRKPTALNNETPKPVVTLVYSRKPRKSKTNVSVSKSKVLKSVSANKKEPSQSWGSIVSDVPSSSLDECRSSKLFSGIWTPAAPSI
ncbi:retrovirus-related pol polyprotein from transposon TNT 1-94 [Tanacetum coccineum]|uniref:Retrovirus-related pol polyprotein from transposon TNT 1-94 n=1 Tax=Tanacetum coccineum TaxID=301880 RepID=A0ABQ4ZYK4_9ASTR